MKDFESRLRRLEEVNEKLKDGSVSLDEAFSFFEEGIRLAKSLEKDLDKAERKIEILVNQPEKEDDKINLELFETKAGAQDESEEEEK
ncbi:MAG: exodeoxyribonuclease VII small subunit [Spirochaetales bacterium]|nr:exodeoxyribonuclease VII small subunit [Spirochaetales bacterium]